MCVLIDGKPTSATAADPSPQADGRIAPLSPGIGAARSIRGVIVMPEFENNIYIDPDRLAILENRAAELERLLLLVTRPDGAAQPNAAVPYAVREGGKRHADAFKVGGAGAPAADGRTEALINRGRPRSRRPQRRRLLTHWRLIVAGMVALITGVVVALVATRGSGGVWPASVATVQAEIEQACANPDVVAEPSGLNFACAKDTNQVLWVFALLTSGDNPNFVDQSTGRMGLEPVQPAQGGDIAWSLNLHHPYDPANPVDSLAVAARAINNIISGAALTSATGSALIEPGLESKAANCQRYTGSAKLAARAGYPAVCASPVTSASGQAALVSDAFQQWMDGTPSRIAREAGVLFGNADNPGNPQARAILASLPASGG
jgi:hypothetical protein